jgi:hypothetical protein
MTQTTEARLSGLRDRVMALDASLAKLTDDLAEVANGFDPGNEPALQKAAAIEQLISKLKAEKALTLAAFGRLEERRREEQAEAEQQAKRGQQVEAKRLADQVAALNVRIDQALHGLVDLFAQRAFALQAMGRTGVVDFAFCNRLQTKGPITAAACAVGLHKFVDIVTVAPGSHRSLASINAVLAGIGKQADPDPAPALRRLANNGSGP